MSTIGELMNTVLANFSIAEAMTVLKPLALFMLGVVVYAVFIFKFYRFVAKRDIFTGGLLNYKGEHKAMHAVSYAFEYIIAMPIVICIWLLILAAVMTFLSRTQSIEGILLTSVALVGAIRVTSYYHEKLSHDLAKLLPLAMLGILLLDVSSFSISASIEMMKQLTGLWKVGIYYLGFIFVIETILRVAHLATGKRGTELTEAESPLEV